MYQADLRFEVKNQSKLISFLHQHLYIKWVMRVEVVEQWAQKKSPNVYKNCPKMISLEKLKILTPLQKFFRNVRDLGKLSVAKSI